MSTQQIKCLRPILATVAMLLLSGCSLFGIRSVEEAAYVVVDRQGDIELRDYSGYITVETIVDGDFEDAGKLAFKRLFGYISGENRSRQKFAMTSRVMAEKAIDETGETIEMTAPVIATEHQGGWRYAFVLPTRYGHDSVPLPLNPEISIAEIKPKRVAVLTFSGSWQQSLFNDRVDRLLEWIDQNRLKSESGPRLAGFDPPWTIPFLRRNEIMIDVSS